MNAAGTRSAGQLLGLLQEQLGFGSLSLAIYVPDYAQFNFQFSVGQRIFACRETVRLEELAGIMDLADTADTIVRQWKEAARSAGTDTVSWRDLPPMI